MMRRCNILFRQALTHEQQRMRAELYANQNGVSVAKLSELSGKDEATLVASLCQQEILPR